MLLNRNQCMVFDWKVTLVDIVWKESNALLISSEELQCMWKYLWMQSMLLLSWRCAERNLPCSRVSGLCESFGGSLGGAEEESGAGQRSLTLSSISDARLTAGEEKFIKTSKLLTAGFHRMPWRHKSRDRGSCSLYGPEGEAAVVLCGLEPPVHDHPQDR